MDVINAVQKAPKQMIDGVTRAKNEADKVVQKAAEPIVKIEMAVIDSFVGGPQNPGDRDPTAPGMDPPLVTAQEMKDAAVVGAFVFTGKTAAGTVCAMAVPAPSLPVAKPICETVGGVAGGLIGLGWNRLFGGKK